MEQIKRAVFCGGAAAATTVTEALDASGRDVVYITADDKNAAAINDLGGFSITSPDDEAIIKIYKAVPKTCASGAEAASCEAFFAAPDSFNTSAVQAAASWLKARSCTDDASSLIVIANPQNFADSLLKHLTEEARGYMRKNVTVTQAVSDRLIIAPARGMTSMPDAPIYAEARRAIYLSNESAALDFGDPDNFIYTNNIAYRAACAKYLSAFALDAAAYLGALKGVDTIADAIAESETAAVVANALADIAFAVSAEYGTDTDETLAYAHDVIKRLAVFTQRDSLRHAAADSEARLAADNPLASVLKMCGSRGTPSEAVCTAVAAAFRYTADAPSALVESYVKINGIPLGLFRYSGITDTAICDAVRVRFDALGKTL